MTTARTVRGAARSDEVKVLGRLGFAARATIYLLIGWFAVLLAVGKRPPEADQRGAMQEVAHHRGGFVVLLALTIGLVGYALWRWSEAAFGAVGHGKKAGPRIQSFFRGCIYAFFAVNAAELLLRAHTKSQANQQQILTTRVMHDTGGRWAVGIAGAVVIVVGLVLVVEGVMRRFKRYFRLADMPASARRIVWVLGCVGTTARGLVFALTGWFVVKAAHDYDPKKARGLDGALRQLSDSPHGRLWVGLVAAGLIAFGLYGYCEAIWRRT